MRFALKSAVFVATLALASTTHAVSEDEPRPNNQGTDGDVEPDGLFESFMPRIANRLENEFKDGVRGVADDFHSRFIEFLDNSPKRDSAARPSAIEDLLFGGDDEANVNDIRYPGDRSAGHDNEREHGYIPRYRSYDANEASGNNPTIRGAEQEFDSASGTLDVRDSVASTIDGRPRLRKRMLGSILSGAKSLVWGSASTGGKEAAEVAAREAVEAGGKEAVEAGGKKVVEAGSKEVVEATGRETAEVAGKEAAEVASKEAAEVASKEAAEVASKEAVEAAGKEAAEVAGRETVEGATKQATEGAVKETARAGGALGRIPVDKSTLAKVGAGAALGTAVGVGADRLLFSPSAGLEPGVLGTDGAPTADELFPFGAPTTFTDPSVQPATGVPPFPEDLLTTGAGTGFVPEDAPTIRNGVPTTGAGFVPKAPTTGAAFPLSGAPDAFGLENPTFADPAGLPFDDFDDFDAEPAFGFTSGGEPTFEPSADELPSDPFAFDDTRVPTDRDVGFDGEEDLLNGFDGEEDLLNTFGEEDPFGTFGEEDPFGTFGEEDPFGTFGEEDPIGTFGEGGHFGENPDFLDTLDNTAGEPFDGGNDPSNFVDPLDNTPGEPFVGGPDAFVNRDLRF